MTQELKITRFGNPVLRKVSRQIEPDEILTNKIQSLITRMKDILKIDESGVGLAAPQVGKSLALSVISIKPTPSRPELEVFETVIINPKIIETYGKKKQLWEGCVSCGTGKDILFARVPRHEKIKLSWLDETSMSHEEIISGFVAHVVQHEVDHLEGVLFVDRVKDASSYMMMDEYRKRVVEKRLSGKL